MPKAYWIAHVQVTDPAQYETYKAATAGVFGAHGGRPLARGGAYREVEGALGRERHVVIEFPSLEAALACYDSPEYQAAKAHRDGAGIATITMVEGID